jgi:hypothetical protein
MTPHLKQVFATAILAVATLQAHAVGRLADLSVVDRSTGASLPVYFHGGQYWVAGKPGARYAISLCNKTGERLLAVTSVDGINVLSGANAAWGQTGYVFARHSCYDVSGWRKSDSEVAAFEFSASSDSYAQLTGRPQELGVIGVALFRERRPEPVIVPPAYYNRIEGESAKESRADKAQSAPAPGGSLESANGDSGRAKARPERRVGSDSAASALAAAPAPMAKLGTAHGQREESLVSHTQFERAQVRPNEMIQIRYDSREALIALGVIADSPRRVPNPFPLSDSTSYVPDPPNRRY